jgi:hypothetical protein
MCSEIFEALKEKYFSPAKQSLKIEGEIKTFHDE